MTHLADAPLAAPEEHRDRLISAGRIGLVMLGVSLAIGIAGYMALEGLDFLDAFLNAAMILSGMGPVNVPASAAGKVFAGFYAIYSGFAVLGIAAVVFAPIVHRMFHRMHIADAGDKRKGKGKS